MDKLKQKVALLLVMIMVLTQAIPVFAQTKPLLIKPLQVIHLENGKEIDIALEITNVSELNQAVQLIVAMYDTQTGKMVDYHHTAETFTSGQTKNWQQTMGVPNRGLHKIKVFIWENMEKPVLLSNVIEVVQEKETPFGYEVVLDETSAYLAAQTPDVMQTVGGEWGVFGLARSEYPVPDSYYTDYISRLEAKILEEASDTSRPFDRKVTETQRLAIALTALGQDAGVVGGSVNLFDYTWNKEGQFPMLEFPMNTLGGMQGINELVFGLLTIDMRQQEAPEGATVTRAFMIDELLAYQKADGGFGLSKEETTSGVDITAMALQALAPYKEESHVKQSIDKALNWLASQQTQTGGFVADVTNGNETSESTAQVIVALTALGIDIEHDTRFIKEGNTTLTNLLDYYVGEGMFKHTLAGEANQMGTEQSHYALVAYDRFVKGKTTLYDMTDVIMNEEVPDGEEPEVPEVPDGEIPDEEEQIVIGEVSLAIEKRTIGKGDTLSQTRYPLYKGDTAWDAIERIMQAEGIVYEVAGSKENQTVYIASVEGDGEFDYGSGSGWKYEINGVFPDVSVSQYQLQADDVIRLRYTTTVNGEELERPLVERLEGYVEEAKTYDEQMYTVESYIALKEAIRLAEEMIQDPIFATEETEAELEVSKMIAQIISGINGLVEDENHVEAPSDIPNDFMNDISLNKDFLQMEIGETYQIIARRLEEVIDNPIDNSITHPDYQYEVISGNSVTVDALGQVTATQTGTSIITVTYGEMTANGKTYGGLSEVNTGLFVVDVTDGIDTGIAIQLINEQNHVVPETRSYDTYYFLEDYFEYDFRINAINADTVDVFVNGQLVEARNGIYTAQLENKGNIIKVVAKNAKGTEVFAQVVDARKVEMTIRNMTDSARHDDIWVGDKVSVAFKGITLPVHKLATIYNPSFNDAGYDLGDTAGAKVAYTSEKTGEKIYGKATQWDLAEDNGMVFTVKEAGDYHFTGGHIDEGWWGSELGTEKKLDGPFPEGGLGAAHYNDQFGQLPDFVVTVSENESGTDGNQFESIEIINPPTTLELSNTSYLLETMIKPAHLEVDSIIFKTSNPQVIRLFDNWVNPQSTWVMTNGVGKATITVVVRVDGIDYETSCEIEVINPSATEEQRRTLKELIDYAKKEEKKLYTTDSWEVLQKAIEEAELVYEAVASSVEAIKVAEGMLQNAINSLISNPSLDVTTSQAITVGGEVHIELPNLQVPEYEALPDDRVIKMVYESNIPGLETIEMENAFVGDAIDLKRLSTIRFTVPASVSEGEYVLCNGYILAESKDLALGSVKREVYYREDMPEIKLIVSNQ